MYAFAYRYQPKSGKPLYRLVDEQGVGTEFNTMQGLDDAAAAAGQQFDMPADAALAAPYYPTTLTKHLPILGGAWMLWRRDDRGRSIVFGGEAGGDIAREDVRIVPRHHVAISRILNDRGTVTLEWEWLDGVQT